MKMPSPLRLNMLRGGYLFLAFGIGAFMWPQLLVQGPQLEPMHGIVLCLLCGLGLLALLGVRYPLQMLPILIFELTWKSIWLLRIFVPLWLAHQVNDAVTANLFAVGFAIVFPFVIPWPYVWQQYVQRPGDPWRQANASRPGEA